MRPTLAALLLATLASPAVAAEPIPAGPMPPDAVLHLVFSLPDRDPAGRAALLHALITPGSPEFRHWLSPSDYRARFAPTETDYARLRNWAAEYGLTEEAVTPSRRLLGLRGTVAAIGAALHITFRQWRDPLTGRLFHTPDRDPTTDLGLPLSGIEGLADDELPRPRLRREHLGHVGTGSGPAGSFLGSDVRAAYVGQGGLDGTGQSVGLFELAGYDMADVTHYFQEVHQPLRVPVLGVSADGAPLSCTVAQRCDDSEQVLDIEQAISVAPGLANVTVYVGHSPILILDRMASDGTSAVLSASWGWKPNPAEDAIYQQMAMQGQSFLDASGDYGSDLKRGGIWPETDANVIAVGGTDLWTAGPGGPWLHETGWKFSGGGPATDGVPLPAYQIGIPNAANQASTTLRNVPDISALASNYFSCFDTRCFTGNGGTSYAAPAVGAILALANQRAAQLGLPAVGFINPLLYALATGPQYGRVLHDQKSGDNGAWTAVAGYDLVTGTGSPTHRLIEALATGK